jgi:hypothetical protein
VDAEEASGFDPSGSSGREGNGNLHSEAASESGQSQRGWSSYTDDTSLSQGMSALDLEGLEFSGIAEGTDEEFEGHDKHLAQIYNAHLENLDDASKEAILIETFPGIRPFDIKWTLNKCKGKAALAIDELLNQVFLEGNGHRHQGIEAFSASELPPRPRKGKGRKKRLATTDDANSSNSQTQVPGAMESKWETAGRDVDFISSRTGMPLQQVSSIYHKNGASVPATISAIIDAHSSLQLDSEDAIVDVNAQELSRDFPTIPFPRILALTQITYPSTAAAHELAKALITRLHPARNGPSIQIEFRLPPPDLDSPVPKTKPKSHNAVYANDIPPPLPSHPATAADGKDYIALRNTAFTQASSASRRGKSDHLMSGAAAYYSSLGRSYDAAARSASAAAADALVASQSSAAALDLHGTNVKDAVRIARAGVTAWWARTGAGSGGGEGGGHTGYRIVTGKGTHSEGGKGKLGPAVGTMLIREGWKLEVGSGFLVVTGVVGRHKAL